MATLIGMPSFFVPKASSSEDAEHLYANLAQLCGRPVPEPAQRVFQIEWVHDGDCWVATVGERLHGRRTRTRRRKGTAREVTEPLSDPAIVLAIFPEVPYLVVTDARPLGSAPSSWANPFMAGRPTSINRFD